MITPEQLERRRRYACSSDAAPIVLGDDGFGRTPSTVWMEKTGRVEDVKQTKQMQRGNLLEPALVQWACEQLGQKYVTPDLMLVHVNGLIAANFDAIEPTPNNCPTFHIEAKSTGLADEYGDEGTDQVPERVLVQVHHAFAVVPSLQVCYVPVLMPGFKRLEFKMYEVPRNDELAERIGAACSEFMERFVRRDVPPPDFAPSLEILKRVRRIPNKTIELHDTSLLDTLEACRRRRDDAIEAFNQALADIITPMDDAEAAVFPDGRVATYQETHRRGYEVKPCTYRQLRIKAAKKEAVPA